MIPTKFESVVSICMDFETRLIRHSSPPCTNHPWQKFCIFAKYLVIWILPYCMKISVHISCTFSTFLALCTARNAKNERTLCARLNYIDWTRVHFLQSWKKLCISKNNNFLQVVFYENSVFDWYYPFIISKNKREMTTKEHLFCMKSAANKMHVNSLSPNIQTLPCLKVICAKCFEWFALLESNIELFFLDDGTDVCMRTRCVHYADPH